MHPDAIQILENTSLKVVVWDPPNSSFGTYLIVLSAALLLPGVYLLVRRSAVAVAIGLIVTGVAIAALASFLATSQRTITLSRSDGTLMVKKSRWGMVQYQSIPISEVRRIAVENIRYNHSLVVITKTGQTFSLGNGSGRDGYDGAADAMNAFLGVGPR